MSEETALMDIAEVRTKVHDLMPDLLKDHAHMVAIPSVAFPGYDPDPVHRMVEVVRQKLQGAGVADARLMDVTSGYPPIYGTLPGPEGAPTVVLYAHCDVQPASMEQGWTSDPWIATTKEDGRIYGRGTADDKGGLAIHLGTLRHFQGRPPCTIKVIIESMEETDSNLEDFVQAHPELFACDLFVVCDMGNLRVGEPALTTTLRGEVACVVTVTTLEHPLHSGEFGGPAPDAMMALARLLASLQNDDGSVAVEGVTSFEWTGAEFTEADFRASADLPPSTEVLGADDIGSRLWSKPSINAIGIDMTSIADSSNVLIPQARAKISMRIVPGSDPAKELDALVAHLEGHAPWGATVEVQRAQGGRPFRAATDGPGSAAAREAMHAAFGKQPGEVGSGGSVPLLHVLSLAAPDAEFVLWGPEDLAESRLHASDESVDPQEIEDLIVAQVLLLQRLAQG